MWVGWNARQESLNTSNKIWPSSAQFTRSIFYLSQMNQSPTSIAVVGETLKRALAFANQSERDSIAVTYDLAIAKIAMQLQAEESQKFGKVFVAMGSFHMELTIFGAIGKHIAESGAEMLNTKWNSRDQKRFFKRIDSRKGLQPLQEISPSACVGIGDKTFPSIFGIKGKLRRV